MVVHKDTHRQTLSHNSITHTKMPRGTRVEKVRTGPKKPLTPFMYFNIATRPKVLEDHPGTSFGDIGKELGKRWKELNDTEKLPYQKQSEEDKKRYVHELEAMQEKTEEEVASEED